ncbi:MAG TPA: right-handed parallel beta-helix repeat-containing protein [Bryobacteraceae bacterium]
MWATSLHSFGAVGNGIADDTKAVQAAVNACAGGTVDFPPGNYLVSGIVLAANCTYAGTAGRSTVTLSSPNTFIFDISQSAQIHITGLTLNGNNLGGIVIAQGYAPAQNILIDYCEFRDVSGSAVFPANLAIVSTWGMINATIQNNRFGNVAGGIWFTTIENVSILNNSFTDITEGDAVYIAPNPAGFQNGDNLKIVGNTGVNLARIAIELFGPDPSNGGILNAPVIENNSFSNWTGAGGMGLSITCGDGAVIAGNRLVNVTGQIQTTGIEVIVTGAQVTNNIIAGGFAEGIAVVGTSNNVIANNRVVDASDNGIILACDNSRNRCTSTNTTVTGNTVINAQNVGIKLDNNWSSSLIARNTVTRTAGYWPQDNTTWFAGIHQSPAPGSGTIDSNNIIQDAISWPSGFWFGGVRLNSSMPGSSVTNNLIRSLTNVPFGSGILDNTGNATQGWIITGNDNINTYHPVN